MILVSQMKAKMNSFLFFYPPSPPPSPSFSLQNLPVAGFQATIHRKSFIQFALDKTSLAEFQSNDFVEYFTQNHHISHLFCLYLMSKQSACGNLSSGRLYQFTYSYNFPRSSVHHGFYFLYFLCLI